MNADINLVYMGSLPVTIDTENTLNGSIAIVGASGCGKSVELQRIACENVLNGQTVLVISQHGTMAEDQIFEYYKEVFDKYRTDVYATDEGVPCSLFRPIRYCDGKSESVEEMVGALADVLSRALKLGKRQKSVLNTALMNVYDENLYQCEGLSSLELVLKQMDTKNSLDLLELLKPILRKNIFKDGELVNEGRLNIVHLERMDLTTQEIVMEILLSYIWRLANADQFKRQPICVFLDESQNIASGAKSPLALMLSEGRKMGVNIVLATQLISNNTQNAVQQRPTQVGLMLFFKPALSQINSTARLISSKDDGTWTRRLRTLKVGEFVAVGNFRVAGKTIDYPLVVSANVDKIHTLSEESKYKKADER